jgi:hypothetical protein
LTPSRTEVKCGGIAIGGWIRQGCALTKRYLLNSSPAAQAENEQPLTARCCDDLMIEIAELEVLAERREEITNQKGGLANE